MAYYTKGDKQLQDTADSPAIIAEFEAERAALEAAFAAVETDTGAASAHATSDGTDHANVVLNDTHRAGDGTDHANVVLNDAHRALVSGNPHQVTPAEAAYIPANSADWAGDPADLQAAVDRIAAQLAAVGAAPIP